MLCLTVIFFMFKTNFGFLPEHYQITSVFWMNLFPDIFYIISECSPVWRHVWKISFSFRFYGHFFSLDNCYYNCYYETVSCKSFAVYISNSRYVKLVKPCAAIPIPMCAYWIVMFIFYICSGERYRRSARRTNDDWWHGYFCGVYFYMDDVFL